MGCHHLWFMYLNRWVTVAPCRISIITISTVYYSFQHVSAGGKQLHNNSIWFFKHLHAAIVVGRLSCALQNVGKTVLRVSGLDKDGRRDENRQPQLFDKSISTVHLRNNGLSHDSVPNFRPILSKSKNTRTLTWPLGKGCRLEDMAIAESSDKSLARAEVQKAKVAMERRV